MNVTNISPHSVFCPHRFKVSFWWNILFIFSRLTSRRKCHISTCCLQYFWDSFKSCDSEDSRLFASCSLEHKINRIWQHDYCITPLTRFNSQTGDNKIMDSSVFYSRSMGFVFHSHSRYAAIFRPVISAVRRERGWREMKKGQFTAGGLKEGVILPTKIKERDHSLK